MPYQYLLKVIHHIKVRKFPITINLLCLGMPPVPLQPEIREKQKSGSIDIRWEMPSWAEDKAVLYIIEASATVGQDGTNGHTEDWQQIAQVLCFSIFFFLYL